MIPDSVVATVGCHGDGQGCGLPVAAVCLGDVASPTSC